MLSSDFIMHLHQPFQLQLNPVLTMWLALYAVQESGAAIVEHEPSETAHVFSVIFQGPQQPVLPARTYQLLHPCLGKLDLLLVPLERRQGGMCYKGVISSAT